jgi:DNA helicase-2/ATP-dependent DNA helicase PcrA
VENEAEEVAKEIARLVNKSTPPAQAGNKLTNYLYRDIAILVRANNHAEPFGRALSRQGIPYQFLGPGRLFRQPEVVDLISYLKVLYNFEDSVALYRVLSLDFFDISARDLASIGNYAKRLNLSLFEACEKVDSLFISDRTKEKIKKILEIINKHFKLLRKETAGQLLYYFLEETELLPNLLNPKSPDAEKRAMNISKFFDKLKTYEVDHEDATVNSVVDWLMLSSELGESPLAADSDWTEINAVNILTAHSAKGLEFPVVFLVNLVAQRFPTIERHEQIPIPESLIKEILPVGDYHIEEERRLFYVGMTRAKDLLYLTAADYYGEGKREKKLSPFIFEALGDKTISAESKLSNLRQLSFLDFKVSEPIPHTAYSIPHLKVDYLSYSQIETFRTCPLHYKLKYIYKIPVPPSAAQSFGTSMHSALKNFYLAIGRGEKPSKQLLFKSLKNSWVKEGFSGKVHEERFFERAKKYLVAYYKKEFNPKNIPKFMEVPFALPLRSSTSVERRGVVPSSRDFVPLKIGGKIDRVDILDKGKIEIIDYKTGANIPTQKDVHHDLQLTFYVLAATNIKEPPFNKKPNEFILTLYYFDNQTKISTTRTVEELEKAKEEIFKVKEEIEKSDFHCSGNILCKSCEYALMCRSEE